MQSVDTHHHKTIFLELVQILPRVRVVESVIALAAAVAGLVVHEHGARLPISGTALARRRRRRHLASGICRRRRRRTKRVAP